MNGHQVYFKRGHKRHRRAAIARTTTRQASGQTQQRRNVSQRPRGAERTILTKEAMVGECVVKLYSFDGNLWASRLKDLVEMERRIERKILDAKRIMTESYMQRV